MAKMFSFLICLISLFACTSCASGKEAKIGEEFTLKSKESISVKDAEIKITLNEIGREWLANGGERAFCSITIKHKNTETKSSISVGKPVIVGDYAVQMFRANPFGNGDATFIVRQKKDVQSSDTNQAEENTPKNKAAIEFLANYKLTVEIKYKESSITFPETLTGLPFTHYQSASSSAGFDLSPYKKKTLALLSFKLNEKTKRGSALFAHLVFDKEKVVGAWMTTDAPVAPGIVSIKTKPSDLSW